MGVPRKQSTPSFLKNKHFLLPDRQTYVLCFYFSWVFHYHVGHIKRVSKYKIALCHILLTHFVPLVSFTSWKHQKTRGFLIFSGGLERNQWHDIGWFTAINTFSKVFGKKRNFDVVKIQLRCVAKFLLKNESLIKSSLIFQGLC